MRTFQKATKTNRYAAKNAVHCNSQPKDNGNKLLLVVVLLTYSKVLPTFPKIVQVDLKPRCNVERQMVDCITMYIW